VLSKHFCKYIFFVFINLQAAVITDDMRKFSPYRHQRRMRADVRFVGKRAKKAKEAADADK
jgi:hypothetical protein